MKGEANQIKNGHILHGAVPNAVHSALHTHSANTQNGFHQFMFQRCCSSLHRYSSNTMPAKPPPMLCCSTACCLLATGKVVSRRGELNRELAKRTFQMWDRVRLGFALETTLVRSSWEHKIILLDKQRGKQIRLQFVKLVTWVWNMQQDCAYWPREDALSTKSFFVKTTMFDIFQSNYQGIKKILIKHSLTASNCKNIYWNHHLLT